MPTRVQIQGTDTILEFPDGMTPEAITTVLQHHPMVQGLHQQAQATNIAADMYGRTPAERLSENVRRSAADLTDPQGNPAPITPAAARSQGIGPALQQAVQARAANTLARARQAELYHRMLTDPNEPLQRDFDVAVGNPNVARMQQAVRNAPRPPSTVGSVLDAALGAGTFQALQQEPGAAAGFTKNLLGFAEPENLVTMAALSPLGLLPGGGPALLAGFGVPALQQAYESYAAGDTGGAVGGLAAFLAPLGLHALQNSLPAPAPVEPGILPGADGIVGADGRIRPYDMGEPPETPQAAAPAPSPVPPVPVATAEAPPAPAVPDLAAFLAEMETAARTNMTARQAPAATPTPAPIEAAPAAVAPPEANRADHSLTPAIPDRPTRPEALPPEDIQVVPGMQYKKEGIVDTENGVTNALKGTDVYDVDQGGRLTVWRNPEGQYAVVNGHHRLELAKRADRFVVIGPDGQNVDVPRHVQVNVLDSADGWTMNAARARGALENIRDNKGTALDALEVIQGLGIDTSEFPSRGISQTSDMARNIAGLQGLDPQALTRVRQGDLPEHVAAGIGSVEGLSPAGQRGAVNEAVQARIGTFAKARGLAEEYRRDEQKGLLTGDNQSDLFDGEYNTSTSTRAIRVELKDAASRKLADERSNLLRPVDTDLRQGENIDAEGRKADALRMAESKKALGARLDLLYRQESVADLVAELAGEVGNGRLTKDTAANALAAAVRPHVGRSIAELADTGRILVNRGSGSSGESAASAPRGLEAGHADNAARNAGDLFATEPATAEAVAPTARLDAIEQAAKERLQNRKRGLNSGVDPEDLRDLAVLGAVKIARGAVKFADWSQAMLAEHGEALRPHLSDLWRSATDLYHSQIAPKFSLPRVEDSAPGATAATPETSQEPVPAPEKGQAAHVPPRTETRTESTPAPQESLDLQIPQEPTRPDSTHNINLERLATGEDVKEAIQTQARAMAADIERARGGRISLEETRQAARDLGLTPEELRKVAPGESAAYAVAVRQLLVDSAQKVRTAERTYRDTPTDENLAALTLATKEHQTILLSAAGHAAEAGRVLSAYRVMAEAFRGAAKPKADPEEMFRPAPVRQMRNPNAPEWGKNNKIFTQAKADAAKARLREKLSQASADPFLVGNLAGALPELIELGGFHLEAGLRQFAPWAAQMRADVSDKLSDGELQTVWGNLRAEVADRMQRPRLASDVFADQLGQRIGRKGAAEFLNAISDEDGNPVLLDKMLRGEDLTPEEQSQIAQAYADAQPAKASPGEAKGALKTVLDAAKEFRAEESAAKKANKVFTPREAFERHLTQRLGVDGAKKFMADVGSDIMDALTRGDTLTPEQRRAVGDAFIDAKPGKRAAVPLDAAAQALKDIVNETRKAQDAEEDEQNRPTPKDILRKILLEDMKGDAERVARKLAALDDNDIEGLNKVMREEAKIPMASQIVSLWKAGLLSSPRTINKILVSHGISLAVDDLTQMPASIVDAIIATKTGKRTILGLSAPHVVKAARIAATQGVREAIQILRFGEDAAVRKGMPQIGQTRENLFGDIHANNAIANAYINIVARAHGMAYRPARLYAFTRALQELARVQARAEGAGDQRATYLLDNPTDAMTAQAVEAAERAVFLNPNALTKGVTSFKRPLPPAGRAAVDSMFPFVKVGSNIFGRIAEYGAGAPIAGLRALADSKSEDGFDLAAQHRFSETFGRQLSGLGLMALGAWAAAHGYAKGYSTNPRKHEENEGSVRVGNRWFQISKMAPVGPIFALGATLSDLQRSHKMQFQPVLHGVVKASEENPVLRASETIGGIADINPARAVGSEIGSAVPMLLSDFAAQIDTTTRKKTAVGDYVRDRIPGARKTLPTTGRPETNKLFDPFNSLPNHH